MTKRSTFDGVHVGVGTDHWRQLRRALLWRSLSSEIKANVLIEVRARLRNKISKHCTAIKYRI